jgi:hypothetical protein
MVFARLFTVLLIIAVTVQGTYAFCLRRSPACFIAGLAVLYAGLIISEAANWRRANKMNDDMIPTKKRISARNAAIMYLCIILATTVGVGIYGFIAICSGSAMHLVNFVIIAACMFVYLILEEVDDRRRAKGVRNADMGPKKRLIAKSGVFFRLLQTAFIILITLMDTVAYCYGKPLTDLVGFAATVAILYLGLIISESDNWRHANEM